MTIYRCTDKQGNVSLRASKNPSDIFRIKYDGEVISKIEPVEKDVPYRYVFNHELPIIICA